MLESYKVWTHVQPLGAVVMSSALEDGRVIRVIGERGFRGCAVAAELDKWLRWVERRKQ